MCYCNGLFYIVTCVTLISCILGYEAETKFNLGCQGWMEDGNTNALLMYKFYYVGISGEAILIGEGYSPTVSTILAAGDPKNDLKVMLIIHIYNQAGAKATYIFYVRVSDLIYLSLLLEKSFFTQPIILSFSTVLELVKISEYV